MKHTLLILSVLLFGYTATKAQTQFWSDDFEDTGSPSAGSRTLSLAEFACNSPATAYFKRTDGTDINPATYSGFHGTKFFAAMDIDRGPTCTNLSIGAGQSITWSGINIAGKHNVSFSGLFGANSAAVFQGLFFAASGQMDSMAVEYRIDGGAWIKIIGIYPNNSTASGGPLALDKNGDRIGDGATLGLTLTEISASIAGTGDSLDLRFNIFVNNGNPGSMAFDHFRLYESTPLWSDNFEDAGAPSAGSRTLSLAEFACNSPATAYFKRTDGTDINPSTYSGFQGAKFFAAMDIDRGPTCTNLSIGAGQSITWSGINIAGKSNLYFSGLFGANSAAVFQGLFFAAGGQMDSMAVEYRIDGGAWTKIIGIYPNDSSAAGGRLAVDYNGDRIGDGTALGLALAEISADITGTGDSLDLRFDIFVNNGNPGSMAFDNFRLYERKLVWSDNFEDTASPSVGSRTLSLAEFACNSPATAYFKRTDGTDINPSTYSGFQGAKFFAAMDIDRGPTCTNLSIGAGQSITWPGINIAGKSNLYFSGLFGANSAAVFQGLFFAASGQMDSMAVEYRIDGGAWTKIIGIYPNNGTASGGPLALDKNGDRIGDGATLGLALAEISGSITGTGDSLDLRFDIFVNNGNPGSMAFDKFRIYEAPPGYVPPVHKGAGRNSAALLFDEDGNRLLRDGLRLDDKANFNCYPNPVHSQLIVEYNAGKAATMNIRITDIMGKVVATQAMHVQQGFNKTLVDMSGLVQGMYNMTIISNSGAVYTSKITKD